MPSINRLSGSITTLVVVASSSAYAQEPGLTDPPAEVMKCDNDQVPADCPAPATPAPAPTAQPMPPPPPPTHEVDIGVSAPKPSWYERVGIGLSVGGGVDDFVGEGFRDVTGTGGGWNVRATVGTRSWFAFEGSYIGSAQNFDMLREDDATLIGNGLQAAARFNVLPQDKVQPFIYAGAAWRHYDISDTTFNEPGIDDSDDVFELPVGIGVAGYVAGLMADVRAEYRGVWGSDLIPALEDNGNDDTVVGEMDRWGITGNLGAEF